METIQSKLAELQVATGSAQQPDRAATDDGSSVQESKQEEEQTTQKEQEEADEARTRKERCIRAFNLNPKKGIAQIKESCVDLGDGTKKNVAASLPHVYPSLAQFLFSETASLNKVKLGEWLGDAADENVRTLAAFSRAFKEPFFRGASIEEALRAYCAKVKLPTESKKIDRIMEAFAVAFVEESSGPSISSNGSNAVRSSGRKNQGEKQEAKTTATGASESSGFRFSSTDAVHILSFSCVMLSKDTHSSSSSRNVDQPSEESFIANHRGIDNGADLPRELLEGLYRSIVANPIVTPLTETAGGTGSSSRAGSGDVGSGGGAILFTNPLRQGWLKKQGGSKTKSWAKRWFIICDGTLFYFAAEGDIGQPKGCFPLADLVATAEKRQITLAPKVGKDFLKSAKFGRRGEMVVGNHKTLVLSAGSDKEAAAWVEVLNDAAAANSDPSSASPNTESQSERGTPMSPPSSSATVMETTR